MERGALMYVFQRRCFNTGVPALVGQRWRGYQQLCLPPAIMPIGGGVRGRARSANSASNYAYRRRCTSQNWVPGFARGTSIA